MTRIELTNELRGDLGELYFKHLCMQRSYAFIRLEDIFNTLTPNGVLEFKYGFDRLQIVIPEEIEQEIWRVCKASDIDGNPSFVFDFLTCKVSEYDANEDLNEKQPDDFCWVEIKTGKSQLSSHQDEVRSSCKIRFALFRVFDVGVPPTNVQIRWEYDSNMK